jgi:hypothetical protein
MLWRQFFIEEGIAGLFWRDTYKKSLGSKVFVNSKILFAETKREKKRVSLEFGYLAV